jgi:large subunit ribosomal protein L19
MRNQFIDRIESRMLRKDLPAFASGDTVRVHTKIKEGDKERIQVYEGVVIRRRAQGARSTFTVRKVSYGVGVERTFPAHSPRIDRVEVVSSGVTRRSRLFFLRGLQGKAARLKEAETTQAAEAPKAQA